MDKQLENHAYAVYDKTDNQVLVVPEENPVPVVIAIPIESVECRRCGKLFARDETIQRNTASWYRCKECQTAKSFLVDLAYSCTIS